MFEHEFAFEEFVLGLVEDGGAFFFTKGPAAVSGDG